MINSSYDFNAVRNFLKANSTAELARDKFHKGERYQVGVKDVYTWLNKNGEIMVIENLTQRSDELVEVTENLNAVRNFLKSNVQQLNETKVSKRGRIGEGHPDEAGSVRDIYL